MLLHTRYLVAAFCFNRQEFFTEAGLASFLVVLTGLGNGFVDLVMLPWTLWQWFEMDVLKERMVALALAGKSVEFLYMMLSLVLLLVVLSLISRRFLRRTVLSLEAFNRKIGQAASWFVLLLMFQQVMIIVMGQVFRGNELLFSPFGMQLSNAELQWLSGQLKFYNAILIAFASAYTFIEGGHVRVDLVYGNLGYRAKRFIDLLGSIVFMLPATILMWWFAWPLATNAVFSQRPMNIFSDKASWRGMKFESSGTAEFTWVWAFKVLILVFAALLFIQAVAFMLRNLWALLSKDADVESHPLDTGAPEPLEPDINLGLPKALSGTTLATAPAATQQGSKQERVRVPVDTSARQAKEALASAGISARQRARKATRSTANLATPSLAPARSPTTSKGDL